MEKQNILKIKQLNGSIKWINPLQIVIIEENNSYNEYTLTMSTSQMISFNAQNPENQQLVRYLNLNRKNIL